MSGAGIQGAGLSVAGFGTSPVATGLGGRFLADRINKSVSHSTRLIDPIKRDYVMDEYGRLLGANHVRHAVQMSVHTERGSSAVQEMGHRLRSLQRITPNFERQVLAVLTEAVQPLIDRGLIEVVGFTAYRQGDGQNGLARGAVYGRFLWRDLTTRQEFKEDI